MVNITKEEVLKIAQLSKIAINEQEIEEIVRRFQDILNYAERVQDIAKEVDIPTSKNINVDREDVIVSSDPARILAQAPQAEDNYFVVPKILDN
jgi:aspartyl-tRNA(Asn)/glutamyl-tRNA(Gln) amidotransferase subunit C